MNLEGRKIRGDFHVVDMTTQSMTEKGFWRLKIYLTESGTSPVEIAIMRSICQLQKKKYFSCVLIIFQFVKNNLRASQSFFFYSLRSQRCWKFCNLRGDNLNSVSTPFLMVCSLTSNLGAILHMVFFGLRQTRRGFCGVYELLSPRTEWRNVKKSKNQKRLFGNKNVT